MKIVIVSDTHNQHEQLGELSGDVLVHCGDMFDMHRSEESDLRSIDAWFGRQNFDLILCVGGNHDFLIEELVANNIEPFQNAVVLQDRRYEHKGVVFYGAPWVPKLRRQAFFKDESELVEAWEKIPPDTDVLITHTPPFSVLDKSSRGKVIGCKHLVGAVARVAPKLHCFGHVHNSAGQIKPGETTFVNAASVNSSCEISHEPVVFEI